MKSIAAILTTLVVLAGGITTPSMSDQTDVPGWICDIWPFVCSYAHR